jgi:hypothetical protein
MIMEVLQSSFVAARMEKSASPSLIHRFFAWCDSQQEKRLLWLAIIVFAHGCIITPITALAILTSGNNFILWPFITAAMGASLVTNLAALPTKITLPVFFLSLVIDVAILISCIVTGLDISSTYI